MTTTTTDISELRTLLSGGYVVNVAFQKKDGTIRKAQITRNLRLIPNTSHPKNVRKVDPKYIFVFDLDKQDWISFHESQFLSLSPFAYMMEGQPA
jgi:hypothetical protein